MEKKKEEGGEPQTLDQAWQAALEEVAMVTAGCARMLTASLLGTKGESREMGWWWL